MKDCVAALAGGLAIGVLVCGSAAQAGTAESLKAILAVGHEGQGANAARAALKEVAAADAGALPAVLDAFGSANPLAANYLRSAVETIADRTLKSGGALPVDKLKATVEDRKFDPRARSLAFEWLRKADPKAAEALVPAMIDDPSPELRREAVDRLTKQGDASEQADAAISSYEQALAGAVDDDQVKALVEKLKKHNRTVNLQEHFGFLPKWRIIGPFDNKGLVGFNAVYPPEEKLDLKATYPGQLGEVSWSEISTKDDYGILDIAKDVKPYKGAVMYLTTDFTADKARPVELRFGTPNAWKIWVNGQPLFAREEYHRGMALDQYRVPAELKPGKNTILVKLCQNEQDQDWAQRYQLQLRVCDSTGSAVKSVESVASKR